MAGKSLSFQLPVNTLRLGSRFALAFALPLAVPLALPFALALPLAADLDLALPLALPLADRVVARSVPFLPLLPLLSSRPIRPALVRGALPAGGADRSPATARPFDAYVG